MRTKQPKLRFPEFSGDWEVYKAKDIFYSLSEKNSEDLPVLSVTQDKGVVYRNNVGIDIKYDLTTLNNYKLVRIDDFIISLRSFQGGFELSDKIGIVSPAYTIFNTKNKNEHNSLFWKVKFKTFNFIESLKTVTFGIRDGKSISFSEFGDLKLSFPYLKEQQKIGIFFKDLDDNIELNRKKLTELKDLKSGLLQKMFPKKGAKVPEVRFPEFSGDWEVYKAKDIFYSLSEKNREDLPVLSVTQDKGVVYRNNVGIDIKYDLTTLNNYKLVRIDDFIISLRSFQGGFELSDKIGIVSPAYTIFNTKNKNEHNSFFWKVKFKTFDFIESLKTVTFGIRDGKSISFSEFGDLKLSFPCLKEQQKIGAFFKTLDELIEAQKNKLALLTEQKKALLQQMFV